MHVGYVSLVLWYGHVLRLHLTLAVAGIVAALVHVVFRPFEELIGTDDVLPIFALPLGLVIVVVGMC